MAGKFILASALLITLALSFHSNFARAEDWSLKSSDGKYRAGLSFSDKATPSDAGLPLYPGATQTRDDRPDGDSVNMGFWGGTFGLKIVVVKLETSDSVEKVAAFYQPALSEYGEVLDCSKAETHQGDVERKARKALTCEKDKPRRNGQLLKSGTRDKQHIVSIKPSGKGATFELIYIEKKGAD